MEVKAIFFDYGGVVGRIDRDTVRDLETKHGVPEGELLRSIYAIPEWKEAETGRIEDEVWITAVNRTLDEKAGRPVPELHAEWRGMWRLIDEDVVALAKALRPKYRVGMISNTTKRLEKELLEPRGLHELFEIVVNSARLGVAKPDAEIYHYAADELGVEREACVHIDDLEPNVQGAIDAGFQSVHYRGHFPDLAAGLRELGVDW